ncbi:tetratricopeptide repeat protein [Streptomyces sp. WAC04114]|uniref:tetratricopeptide repeat protein n=1 Tax=Streptomyces sp. WAC04114 TaxID=2867961 RepID=UPI001C8C5AD0|nr:tetratricopeptide repeat protein [Streptomyces sp. WAC04114]MBX9361112.1 ATP-binding protein [Streptomyces sp. WAC04114]
MGFGRSRAERSQAATASGHGHVIQVNGDGNMVCASGPEHPTPMLRLPAEPTHLAGREKEAEDVLALLAPSSRARATPVVSVLSGLPGIGKTALALHVAHQAVARGWFPGGALFLHLRGHDPAGPVGAEEAIGTLARALCVEDAMTPDEQTGLCQAALNRLADEGRAVLLIADDASSAAQIERLVPARSAHRLLVTSRHLLTGPSFQARLFGLDELEPRGAADLIAEALRHARPDDPRLRETDAIAELAGHCGHHPLALQIAASLLTTDPGRAIVELVAELADAHTRLDVLRYEDGGHTTAVQAAFHLSYQRLLPHHRQLFRQFALNPGPDTGTDAAAALWGQPRARTRNGLAALARAGLLAEQPVGSGRWRMHDLLRVYAARLVEGDSATWRNAAFARLLKHCQKLVQAANAHLHTIDDGPLPDDFRDRAHAVQWLEDERANLMALIARAAVTGHPRAVLDLQEKMRPFLLSRRSYATDAVTVSQLAVDCAREIDHPCCEATALNYLSQILPDCGRVEEAVEAASKSLDISRSRGDRARQATALTSLGAALQRAERFEDAVKAHTESLTVSRELGDQGCIGKALMGLADTLHETRRYDEATDVLNESVRHFAAMDDWHAEGLQLMRLGDTLFAMKQSAEAVETVRRALALYQERGDEHHQAIALQNLWSVSDLSAEEAVDNYQRLVAICHKVWDRALESVALNALGDRLKQLNRYEEAVAAYREAAAIHEERDEERLLLKVLNSLGIALRTAGRITEAVEVHEREIELARARGDMHKEAEALERLATTLRCGRRRLQAVEARIKAVGIYREQNDTWCEDRTLADLGLRVRDAPRAERTRAGYTWVLANVPSNNALGEEGRTLAALMVMQMRAGHVIAAFWAWVTMIKCLCRLQDEGVDEAPWQYIQTVTQLSKTSLQGAHPFRAFIALRNRFRRPTT